MRRGSIVQIILLIATIMGFLCTWAPAQTWGPWLQPPTWEQGGHFNNKCPYLIPYVPGVRRPVGCTATALGQILNYWQYPKCIPFRAGLEPDGDEYKSGSMTIFGDSSKYGFPTLAEMQTALSSLQYNGDADEEAFLSFACGVKLCMSYGFSQSGACVVQVAEVLLNDMGYGSAVAYSPQDFGVWNTYESDIIDNLKNGWPVQIAINEYGVEGGHSVVVDGYRDDHYFHVNYGWGSSRDAWYDIPYIGNYDVVSTVVFNICTCYGWPQYGFDQYNRFRTVYGVPATTPHIRYTRSTQERIQGFIIGEGNWIFTTHNPEIINDSSFHPKIIAVDQYGTVMHDLEIADTSSTISQPVQAPDGDVWFGAGDGVYRFQPHGDGSITRVYYDAGNTFYGDSTPRVDSDGYMYFGSDTTLVSIDQGGNQRWQWDVPSGGVMYAGIPSVDSGKDNVYVGYWVDASDEAVLVCINRSTGATRYSKTFSTISTADRGIHTPAVGSDGTVYASVRTKIYALTPGASSFSEKWVQDKIYARYQPIALGTDDSIYTEYWTLSGGNYYLTLAKLDPSNGNVIWEKPKPDVGTYSSFCQPICSGNGVVLFPVYWDSSPNDTWQLYAYSTAGDQLWNYILSPASAYDMAVAAGKTLCIVETDGNVLALSDGAVGDPQSGGMAYANDTPPTSPANPFPTDNATNQPTTISLSWTCSDPDGHALTYDLFTCRLQEGAEAVFFPVTNRTANASFQLTGLAQGATYLWKVIASDGQTITYGPTWSFNTEPPLLSYITISGVTEVNESSGAQYTCTAYYSDNSSVDLSCSASWSDNSDYASINSSGYLTTTAVSSDQSCRITATYGGQSDTHDMTIKDVTATPSKATSPSPASGTTGQSINSDLSWANGGGASSYHVYFGPSGNMTDRGTQIGASYDPGTLSYNTMYQWQIDAINDAGTTAGDVWSFTTQLSGTPGTLQFNVSSASVNENEGSLILTVTRSGGSSGAASVNYATANGTASAGTDYTATSSQLTWSDGNSDSKAITIPILNRSGTQGSRSFIVTISGASGAPLGAPDSATVTITDSAVSTYYVSPNGNDASAGTSWTLAKKTIQAGVDVASSGDMVLVTNGTYILSSQISVSKGITVKSSNGSRMTTVDGNNATRCFYLSHSNAVVDGFTVMNGYAANWGGGVCVEVGTVQNCIIRGNTGTSYSGAGGGGVCVFGGTVQNCTISRNTGYGVGGGVWVYFGGTVQNCTIIGNTVSYWGGGVYVRGGAVQNCIIYYNHADNSGNNLYISDEGGTVRYSCTNPMASGTDNITSDPQFVDSVNGNYRLQSTSPCINAGFNQDWMLTATDLDGNNRIIASIVDIGAYEYQGSPTTVSASDGTYNNYVHLTWSDDNLQYGINYTVYRNTINDPYSASQIAETSGDGYSGSQPGVEWYDYTAEAGIVYYYWVKVWEPGYPDSKSDFSNGDSGYRGGSVIVAPLGVSASDGTYSDKVRIMWNAVGDATAYEVWRYTSDSSDSASKISSLDPTGTSYDDTSATAGVPYYYWVKAVNAVGASPFSVSDSGFIGVVGPLITANGLVGDVYLNSDDPVTIAVQMMNIEPYIGTPVDWWVVACAGSSWYYLNNSFQWTEDGNLLNWHPVHQGGLFNLPATEVLNITGLGTGSYTFYFAVDLPMNGILNMEQIYADSVTVIVQ